MRLTAGQNGGAWVERNQVGRGMSEVQETMHTLQSGIAQATPEQRPVVITGIKDHLKEAKFRIGMYHHLLKLNEQEAQANVVALT